MIKKIAIILAALGFICLGLWLLEMPGAVSPWNLLRHMLGVTSILLGRDVWNLWKKTKR